MTAHAELLAAGVPTRAAAALTGVSRATAARARARAVSAATPVVRAVMAPVNRLGDAGQAHVLGVLNSDEFVDAPPVQVHARLPAAGTYLCSVSTMYRVLAANAQVKERRRLARHPARVRPEPVATGPGQVHGWDITKPPGPSKGSHYDAYVMIDIYPRHIVGAHVHAHGSGLLAQEMMRQIHGVHGVPQVVHADRGTSMTSRTIAALLSDLNVTRSHSHPKVSNDNPHSEAWSKTLKYAPVLPERFGPPHHARTFMDEFVQSHNHEHHHTGIGPHTAADVHHGLAGAKASARSQVLAQARAAHPERFATETDPKIPTLPETAWINPPLGQDAVA